MIGVTMDTARDPAGYQLSFAYAAAIERAGGLTVPLPYRSDPRLIPELLDHLDGIVLSGGDDLDPALYGETWHPQAVRIDPMRQAYELALVAEVDRRDLPALGICLGMQLMNVHRGGSLHQCLADFDRPRAIDHRRSETGMRRHAIRIERGSLLHRAVAATDLSVNSSHQQAVHRPGRGLVATAVADDGIIEAIEDPARAMFVGVEWHPERLLDEPGHTGLFLWLVDLANTCG